MTIAATQAPWLQVLDADDFLLPGATAMLASHGASADFVAGAPVRVSEDAPSPVLPCIFSPEVLNFERFVLGNLGALKGPLDLGFIKPMFRREFIDRHKLRYRENLRLGEDYEFYARALALNGRFLLGGPAGYVSVERTGSLSNFHGAAELEALRDCDNELAKIPGLTRDQLEALDRHWTSVDCRLQWRRLISAVKERDARAALRAFHSPPAALYLAHRLSEQVVVRSSRHLGNAHTNIAAPPS